MHAILPDGTRLDLPDGATGLDVARAIGPRLAEATAAVTVDGTLQDLRLPVPDGANVRILRVGDAEALPVLRHSTAHVLAEAARHVFPGVKVTIGPAIDNGFYYDFDFPEPIAEADLARIEEEMRRILASGEYAFARREVTREEARARFEAEGERYKVELVDGLPADDAITFYTQDDFTDLCRGPHLQTTKPIRAFRLTSLAGAYWRGDASREQLTRVYGTAFWDQKALDEHLHRLEEAKRRDHRRIGPQLGLFSFHHESPGSVFWHPNGMKVWNALAALWREQNEARGYTEVRTPLLYDSELWKTSGHWGKYSAHMYTLEIDERPFGLKPMNCPAHCLMFAEERRSYRELPLRLAEMGHCHRNEASGALHGLIRVRSFTQDDAHIFCTPEQIQAEVLSVIDFALFYYDLFGLEYRMELSTRPEERVGDDDVWDMAEAALAEALDSRGIAYVLNPGDGAFYGPKIDLHLTDSIGRSWQCGTIQLDFNLPERFGLVYTGADDAEHRPVMIHRALYGSFERFIGILTEHYAGAFPFWLAPVQVAVLPIADRHAPYADGVAAQLRAAGLRASVDARGESVGKKIAEAETQRVPVMLVVGDAEAEAGTAAVRRRGAARGPREVLAVAELAATLAEQSRTRS